MMDQREFNQKVVDILDQLAQDVARLRRGSTVSNMGGIQTDIFKLKEQLIRDEPLTKSIIGGLIP
jgi:hypothetical protein